MSKEEYVPITEEDLRICKEVMAGTYKPKESKKEQEV